MQKVKDPRSGFFISGMCVYVYVYFDDFKIKLANLGYRKDIFPFCHKTKKRQIAVLLNIE